MEPLFRIRNPKYGWIPDLPDRRDYLYAKIAPQVETMPRYVDLRGTCTVVEDQGELGSCTACALVGNLEFLKKRNTNKNINFSRLFLYYNERIITHTKNTDSGASLRDGIKTLVKAGDCREVLWPYVISLFANQPPAEAYTDALQYQILNYYRLRSLSEMKNTLSHGYPFVFGFAVYESFESSDVSLSGIVPLPSPSEHLLGGHAVMAVGYDEDRERFILRNSWGSNWGDHGYFYMPYEYHANDNLSNDFWTVRTME